MGQMHKQRSDLHRSRLYPVHSRGAGQIYRHSQKDPEGMVWRKSTRES